MIEAQMHFGTPCILSSNQQILFFPFCRPSSCLIVSDLKKICAQSWGHIEAFRAIISLKTSSQQPWSWVLIHRITLYEVNHVLMLQGEIPSISKQALRNSCELLRLITAKNIECMNMKFWNEFHFGTKHEIFFLEFLCNILICIFMLFQRVQKSESKIQQAPPGHGSDWMRS